MDQEPVDVEQGAQCESCHVSIYMTPKVCHFRDDSGSRSHRTHDMDDSDGLVYASFNLQNINAPVSPKWKHNDHMLEEYEKLKIKQICFSFGVFPMGKTSTTIFSSMMTRCMILTT